MEQVKSIAYNGTPDEIGFPAGGGRSGPGRKGKSVDVDEAGAVDDIERLLKIRIGFAGETDDDVGCQGWAVKCQINSVDQAKKIITGVLAIHFPQDGVGTTLQW